MSDIFISYKRDDLPRARLIAKALEARGFSVWWDRKIPPGKSFDQVIQEALDEARCVIVLWSESSVRSNWVKEEAEHGASRGILVPVLIDDVPIPLGFGRIQTASLVGWNGGDKDREFVQLKRTIRNMLGRPEDSLRLSGIEQLMAGEELPDWAAQHAEEEPRAERMADPSPPSRSQPSPWRIAIAIALLILAAGVGFDLTRDGSFLRGAFSDAVGRDAIADEDSSSADQPVPPAETVDVGSPPLETTPSEPKQPTETAPPNEEAIADPLADLRAEDPVPTETEPASAETLADDETSTDGDAAGDADEAATADACYRELFDLIDEEENADDDGARELVVRYEDLWDRCSRSLDSKASRRLLRNLDRLQDRIELAEAAAATPPAPAPPPPPAIAVDPADSGAGWATIVSDDDFVTCRGVERSGGARPIGISDTFPAGQVWIFARVRAPRSSETVSVRWLGRGGSLLREQRIQVQRNLGAGYRVFAAKSYPEAGRYEVQLVNGSGTTIARREFEIE